MSFQDAAGGRPAWPADAGERVTVAGWVASRRDHGGLVFVDLRDRAGRRPAGVRSRADSPTRMPPPHELRNEFVIQAEGVVTPRSPETVNPKLPTGRSRSASTGWTCSTAPACCRSSWTRRTSTSRCACTTATSTCAATDAPQPGRASG